jgi:hypothetical protein
MMSPFPEQGPMFAVKVVVFVIVAPHSGLVAKTGVREKISVEPRTVKISRMLTRIGIGLRFKETSQLPSCAVKSIYEFSFHT